MCYAKNEKRKHRTIVYFICLGAVYILSQYCIYLRKSRADTEAESRGEGETLARHEKALLELAKRQRLTITQIYREIVSGETIAARPIMQKLLQEVEQGKWAGVLVMEIERLARGDSMDQGFVSQAFKYSNTKIITPMKTYDPNNEFDEEFFEFSLFMSRREYKVINRRLQRGRIASVKEGKYVGSIPPYGYIRKKLERDKGYTLEPHPEQSDIVRLIFDLYTTGEKLHDKAHVRLGISLIARRLNELKIPPQKGMIWTAPSIRDILINPVYIGKTRWGWRPKVKKMEDGHVSAGRPRANIEDCILADGLHKGIIDHDIFALAQEFMKKNPPRPIKEGVMVKNPLSGIVVCGKCGRKMIRRPYGTNYPDTLMCPLPGCENVSSHLYLVESRLMEALEDWLKDYKLKWSHEDQIPNNTQISIRRNAIKKTDEEIAMLENQLGNVHDLLERGIYDTEKFLDRTRELGERIKKTKEDRTLMESGLRHEEAWEESQSSIIPKVERVIDVYNDLPSPQAKNDLLKEVLEKVVYTKDKSARWNGALDEFVLVLYPKLPNFG